jgi:hypothetical protein
MTSIGSLNEKSLHAALKAWCLQPGDLTEVPVDGYIIDIVRGDLLMEVQTRNFSAIKAKLLTLTAQYPVRLIYPITQQKWIVRLPTNGRETQCRRKSPKQGTLFHVFDELASFPELLINPNFSLHIVLIHEEELRCFDSRCGWRRKGWVTHERRLLRVMKEHFFENPEGMEFLIPTNLSGTFTTADLASALNTSRRLAQRMAYCLNRMNLFTRVGKRGNAIVYRHSKSV